LGLIDSYADQTLRTISLAYRDLKENEGGPVHDEIEEGDYLHKIERSKEFTLVAIIGIRDVIRSEVPDAVKKCQDAGINVRMVTGDNLKTAKAIARECGILNDDLLNMPDAVMEG
jgi:magnesium-transporting ATPase (P-type)